MCAAGVRRVVSYRPALSYPVLNHRLSRWHRRAANDNRSPVIPTYRFVLLLAGMALICALALIAALPSA